MRGLNSREKSMTDQPSDDDMRVSSGAVKATIAVLSMVFVAGLSYGVSTASVGAVNGEVEELKAEMAALDTRTRESELSIVEHTQQLIALGNTLGRIRDDIKWIRETLSK